MINRIDPILSVVRRTAIGRRHRISRAEMRRLLQVLSDYQMIDLENGWVDAGKGDGDMTEAWAQACRGITVISVLSDSDFRSGSNPGSIRYDDPGSMHPMLRPTLMFASAEACERHETLEYLRDRAKRVLIVDD